MLMITNLTQDQRAIIARQDKIEAVLNSNQVLLATLVEKHNSLAEQHQKSEEAMQEIARTQVELSKNIISINGRINVGKSILTYGAAILLSLIGLTLGHFIK